MDFNTLYDSLDIGPKVGSILAGVNWIYYVILAIILIEVIYFILIKKYPRRYDEEAFIYVVKTKLMSICLSTAVLFALSFIVFAFPMVIMGAVSWGIGYIYIRLNYLFTKGMCKVETKEEYEKRMKEEDKIYLFKIGEKVRVKDCGINRELRSRRELIGKTLTIKSREIEDGRNLYYVVENKKCWKEQRLEKIGGKKKCHRK